MKPAVKPAALELPTAYLERYPEAGGPAERTPLWRLPFVIGRSEAADHTVYSSKVSKEHAVIEAAGGRYQVRDLGSTNGTFVNGARAAASFLADGDIIHLAHIEFCFRHARREDAPAPERDRLVEQTQFIVADQPSSLIRGGESLRELLAAEAVEILFQPIVDLRSRSVLAFEALARGTHPELSANPATLLALAEQCDLVVELSRLFARRAVLASTRLPAGAKVFVNVHPQELTHPELLDALTKLAALTSPDHRVVLEIAEASVTDVSAMIRNRDAFMSLGLQFAYDDFGAGQARLIELADIPPDYLKFDKAMIEGIEAATPRQEMVSALLRVVRRLGVRVIAEGVETEVVAGICERLGCDLGQGFLFGRPA
ncbi:MAG TPA: EAL domain-containing protein [Vicinamibacterales bacterium]|nr:EAL domain-containing protein [Vicinamibacterales bacterium]